MKSSNYKLLFILVIFYQLTFAQTHKFQYGFEVGPSITTLSGYKVIGQDNFFKLGYTSSVYLKYKSAKHFSLKTQIGIANKGTTTYPNNLSSDEDNSVTSTSINLNYLEIPMIMGLNYPLRKFTLFGTLGGYYGVLLSQGMVTRSSTYTNGKSSDQIDNFNGSDYGIASSIGIEYKVNRNINLVLESGRRTGLADITIDTKDIHSSSKSILFGVNFKL